MAIKSGAETISGWKIGSTWGTAVAVGTGNKAAAEITINDNTQELSSKQVGSGLQMVNGVTRGSISPSISISGDGAFTNGMPVLLAQLLGTSAAPTEVTASQGDYRHTITFNSTLNSKYLTIARETSSTTTEEVPSAAVRSFSLSTTSIPGYLAYSAELIGDQIVLNSSTNTNATLASATFQNSDFQKALAAAAYDDDFQINAQSGGALSTSNQLDIISYSLQLDRPQETPGEIRNAAGLGAPIMSDLFGGSLTVVLKSNADNTYHNAWANETLYKTKFIVTGAQIGSGTSYAIEVFLPGLQLIQKPKYDPVSPGVNNVTLTFKLVQAAANPTGMSSTYPYFVITNTQATSLLA